MFVNYTLSISNEYQKDCTTHAYLHRLFHRLTGVELSELAFCDF